MQRRKDRPTVPILTQVLVALIVVGWLCHFPAAQNQAQIEPEAEPWWIPLAGIILVMLGNAVVVAAESALGCLRPVHLRMFAEADSDRATARLQELIEHKSRYLAATAFGIQACRLLLSLAALVLSPIVSVQLHDRLGWLGALVVATLVFLVPILLVNMIVELVAKSYGELHAHRVALRLYRPIRLSATLFAIPTALVVSIGDLVAQRFGGRASFSFANQAEEEIKTLAESAEESGEFESDEKELLHSVFEFADTVVREVMTPRVDLDALPVDSDPDAAIELIKQSGHSRIPLFEGTDDAIVGIVHAKDLLIAKRTGKPLKLRDLMRRPIVVPENKDLHDLLRDLRQSRSQMAVVQDEFGGTAGIATIEDIVEELVGEIVDEYDTEEPEIVPTDDGLLVDGRTSVDDVNAAMGSEFESEEFDTIGGYVFGLFGRQPNEGESIEDGGFAFTVAATDGRRIAKLQIGTIPIPGPTEH
jgi:putative hemolysin